MFFALSLWLSHQVVDGLDFSFGRTQVGVITFSQTGSASVNFYLNTYTTKQDVMNALVFR